jgi:threonine aldolase
MANLLAALAQTRPGESVILHEDSHPFRYESGNLAMVGGVLTQTVGGPHGMLTAETARAAVHQTEDPHVSNTTLIALENTTNRGGGAVYPLDTVAAIGALARERGIRTHCDGARLFNALVASGHAAADYARHVDTVSFCFSKGLGAPVGSVLAGDQPTLARAYRYRKMLGGGMRQAGVVAAAAMYALDHHIDRLAEDHARLQRFRAALDGTPGVTFPMPSPTNILYLDVPDAAATLAHLKTRGVLAMALDENRIRLVFHLDIDDAAADAAARAFREAAGAR